MKSNNGDLSPYSGESYEGCGIRWGGVLMKTTFLASRLSRSPVDVRNMRLVLFNECDGLLAPLDERPRTERWTYGW